MSQPLSELAHAWSILSQGTEAVMDIISAAAAGDLEAVREAIRRGDDINRRDSEDGVTALMMAAMWGYTEIVRELLSSGAIVDLADKYGTTALMKATVTGHIDTVRELLSSGATVNQADKYGSTALIMAADRGHQHIFRELLLSGATVDLANKFGKTALDVARNKSLFRLTIINLLEEAAKAKVEPKLLSSLCIPWDKTTVTLFEAADRGQTHIIREQIKSGTSVDVADENGTTALMKAAERGHTDTVKELLALGANVDLANKDGTTALMKAAKWGRKDNVTELLSAGATVDLADKDGTTALMKAASQGSADNVQELLSSRASVDLANKYGTTALMRAAVEGRTNIVKELVSSGATVDLANKDGVTALMMAAMWGYTDTVRELLSSGATVDLADKKHCMTALEVARVSRHSNPAVIGLLKATAEIHEPPQHVKPTPILPRNWTAVLDGAERQAIEYVDKTKAEDATSTLPHGYPLYQTSTHPDVTFYDEPQQKEVTSSGGHFDFDNGVEVTVPPDIIKAGYSVNIKVQPSLAPKDVFVMPQGIQSASPSYLLSSEGADVDGEVTVTIEHHVRVETKKEADDLLFLQADWSPERTSSKCTYEYEEIPESRSEFFPGENKGRLITKHFSGKFFKVGSGQRASSASKGDTGKSQLADSNLYTVRVYRSPPQTTGEKMAILCVSLYGRFYTKFLDVLDREIIPHDYPEVSTRAADRTTKGSLQFTEMCVRLDIQPLQGWTVEPDSEMIMKAEVDQPETENYKPEDLHDYPPKIVCRFYPEVDAPKRVTSKLSLAGIQPDVVISIPLKVPKVQIIVDTRKLQEAADSLKSTALQVNDSQLGSAVNSILSLIDRMTSALKSSSLSDLAVHTESIKKRVNTVLEVSRKVTEECSRETIRENIEFGLSKIEALSHQLCQVTNVKLKHCQDQSEEIAALEDRLERVLVEWLHTGTATIHQLLRALQDRTIRRRDIAMEIQGRVGEERSAVGLCETTCSVCNLDTY